MTCRLQSRQPLPLINYAVRNAVREIPEPGNTSVYMREIREAVLLEVSAVARPAYGKTGIAQRDDGLYITDNEDLYRWL